MDSSPLPRDTYRFRSFEVNLRTEELRKHGVKLRIQGHPFRLLLYLIEHRDRVVTREELQKQLWPDDTFVDFEDGLNSAIKKLRDTLGDDAAAPRYIETLPRRGYRFIESVESGNGDGAGAASFAVASPAVAVSETASTVRPLSGAGSSAATALSAEKPAARGSRPWMWVALGVVFVAILGLGAVWLLYGRPAFSFSPRDSVLVADFENQTGDPRFDAALRTAFVVSLEQSRHANIFPQVRLGSVLQLMGKSPTERITPAIGREICQRENIRGLVTGSITRTGQEYALSAELIDPQTGATVRSYAERSYGEDHVLDALDVIASDIRRDLGESLYQTHRANRPLPQVTTSSLTALKQYADSVTLWHQGRFKDAATLLHAALQSDPDFAMAHAALGAVYFSYVTNAQDQGKQEFDKALALSSRTTDRERMIIQAEYADNLGHVSEADALYRAYLSRYPDDWQMLSNYAHLLRTNNRATEAIAQYNQLLRVAPDDANTYVQLATAYRRLNDLPHALAAYAAAFRLDPHRLLAGDASREYGSALVQSGDEPKAAQIFTGMLENPRTRENGMRSLALLDMYHGRYANAKQRFEQCLLALQKPEAALSRARVHLWLAFVADGQGDLRTERQQLDVAMSEFKQIGPKVIFGSWIGQQYARVRALPKAEKMEALISPLADSKNDEQMAYLHLLQGEIALAQEHADKAIELFTQAGAEGSNSNAGSFCPEALARAYQQAGKKEEAAIWYEKALSLPLDSVILWEPQQRLPSAQYTLAADYLARGDREKARQTLDPLLNLWKNADGNLTLRKQALQLRDQIQ